MTKPHLSFYDASGLWTFLRPFNSAQAIALTFELHSSLDWNKLTKIVPPNTFQAPSTTNQITYGTKFWAPFSSINYFNKKKNPNLGYTFNHPKQEYVLNLSITYLIYKGSKSKFGINIWSSQAGICIYLIYKGSESKFGISI